MRSIMMSIYPEWVEEILNGKKTVEVRKTRPKLDTPFKVYIYCTKGAFYAYYKHCKLEQYGKVVAEFTCDKIENIDIPYPAYFNEIKNKDKLEKDTCLTLMQMHHYLGTNTGYLWHISELKVYDKPKELTEFNKSNFKEPEAYNKFNLTRPPQSWEYVKEETANESNN